MDNVHDIDDESRHDDFLTTSEVHKNKKREYIWSVFNIFRKLIEEHSDEILNVRCFDFWSPSWTRSINDEAATKWEKAFAFATSVQEIEVVRVRAWVLWEARARQQGAGQRALHEAEHEEREREVSPLPACSGTPIWERVQGQKSFTRSQGTSSKSWRVPNGSGTPWAWCWGGGAPLCGRSTEPEEQPSKALSPFNALRVPAPRVWVSAAGQRAHFGVFGQSSTLSSGISCSWRCVRDSRCHQDIRCSDGIWRCHSVQKCLGWRCLWGLQGHDVGVWEETRVASGTTVISVQKTDTTNRTTLWTTNTRR